MTHVFIVNQTTFNIHLQYMFAGTGFSTYQPSLYSTNSTKYDYENTFTGMIADISKVREGDKVLFYVTGCRKFFGVFKIVGVPFFEPQNTNYLGVQLDKYLSFRVKIAPYKVYANGISEQQALDDIKTIDKPYQMCWSMIYRKLTGMRGCSFLMDYEMERMETLLDNENNSTFLNGNNFYYDKINGIIANDNTQYVYQGVTTNPLSIDTRLHNVHGSHEGHLQAYIVQNYDVLTALKTRILPQDTIKKWIGNEVVCSVGERRIDLLTIVETSDEIQIRIIELKDEAPRRAIITDQLPWYIKWVDEYVVPNLQNEKPVKIIPMIIAYPYGRNTPNKRAFEDGVDYFNNHLTGICSNAILCNIECIYYDRTQNPIKIY